MTTTKSSVLKDVVAYVDVWSSDKTANYSKPFVQQLQEMGAQVSKTFNKQVTHVVFSNGHPATWRKAKKSDVKIVSVLWLGRCYDDGVRVDEDLYPAIDETNPVMKNKKHRCMQPKDSPERTPENDRRMRKKLDKMMKDLAPKQPLVTDVSPIIIDEESGIVYSPGLKRSDYMRQRLKDMKQKRENLSPTDDESDDDSSASAAEPAYSPDKEEGRIHRAITDHGHLEQRHKNATVKPWLSPCSDVPKIKSPLICPDFADKEDEKGNRQKKSRRTSVRKKSDKQKSVDLLEIPCQDTRSDSSKNLKKEKRLSQIKSSSLPPNKSEKGTGKMKAAKSFTETKTNLVSDTENSSSSRSSQTKLAVAAVELSKVAAPSQKMERKTPKQARLSLSSLVRSFTLSGDSKTVASDSTGDDNVFEDYFSPANCQRKSNRALSPNLPVQRDIQVPFELGSVQKERKHRRSESIGSETNSKKKRKLEETQTGKNPDQQSDAGSEPRSHPQQDVKESLNSSSANATLVAKRRRQSVLPFTSTGATSDRVKKRRVSVQSTMLMDNRVPELQKNSDVSARSHTLKSRGNECTVAAGFTEIPSDGGENPNEQDSFCLQKMVNKTKAMRTLVMTSMPTEKQHIVDEVVKSLGGFLIADRVCESTTHVVSGGHRRTLNILLGIARGCWILSFEWILWCLEQRQWIPEEPYELSDQFPAAQICRLQRHLSAGEHQQDLFQSQPAMFVSQHSQPPTQSLVELIQLCGGTVCKSVRQAGICIGKYSGRRPEGSRILSEQWVLDSITHLKRLSYDNYDLE